MSFLKISVHSLGFFSFINFNKIIWCSKLFNFLTMSSGLCISRIVLAVYDRLASVFKSLHSINMSNASAGSCLKTLFPVSINPGKILLKTAGIFFAYSSANRYFSCSVASLNAAISISILSKLDSI
ncbi:hypothetical protein ES703_93009 [subsurface metagenome]